MNIDIDDQRLNGELDALGLISSEPSPVVTRVVFSEADLRGREFVKRLCRETSLTIREDAVGNTFARWQGREPELAAVGTGSHIDAIPNAGRYDGTVGVLGGIEAIRALQRAGYSPRRSIELLLFTSEEPTRFGVGCLGSRLLCGALKEGCDQKLVGNDGLTLQQARTSAGFTDALSTVPLPLNYYSAFVELHIEQGPSLEASNTDLGVVTAIAAPSSMRIFVEGEGGHAGAVLMPDRRDAFLAAAEIALAVEAAAKSTGSRDTVGTVGVCDVFPGAINSIPSRTKIEIDARDIDEARRDLMLAAIRSSAEEICSRRKVQYRIEPINADPPAQCAPEIVEALLKACAQHGRSSQTMISRAYHDSLFMARVCPTGMLFIPCRGGVSHRPDEYCSPEAIANGALILAEALAQLAA